MHLTLNEWSCAWGCRCGPEGVQFNRNLPGHKIVNKRNSQNKLNLCDNLNQ